MNYILSQLNPVYTSTPKSDLFYEILIFSLRHNPEDLDLNLPFMLSLQNFVCIFRLLHDLPHVVPKYLKCVTF